MATPPTVATLVAQSLPRAGATSRSSTPTCATPSLAERLGLAEDGGLWSRFCAATVDLVRLDLTTDDDLRVLPAGRERRVRSSWWTPPPCPSSSTSCGADRHGVVVAAPAVTAVADATALARRVDAVLLVVGRATPRNATWATRWPTSTRRPRSTSSSRTRDVTVPRGALGHPAVAVVASSVVAQLALLVSGPLVVRLLGVSGRGELASSWSVVLGTSQLAMLGLPTAVTWFAASRGIDPARIIAELRRGYLVQVAVTALAVGAAVALLSGGGWLRAVVAVAGVVALMLAVLGLSALQGAGRFGAFAILQALPAVLYAVAVTILWARGTGSVTRAAGAQPRGLGGGGGGVAHAQDGRLRPWTCRRSLKRGRTAAGR